MKLNEITLTESAVTDNGGHQYEKYISSILKLSGLSPTRQRTSKTFNAHSESDLYFVINNKKYLLEVKADWAAQMGSTSINYNPGAGSVEEMFVVTDKRKFDDPDLMNMIHTALGERVMQLGDFIEFIRNYPSNSDINKKVTRFPMFCTQKAWQAAQKYGLLKQIGARIKYDASIIVDHYKQKNIHYIQIGGLGAFYLAENPANLPIPQLTGEVELELRGVQGGAKPLQGSSSSEMVNSCILRMTPRLKFRYKSPYTFDHINSIDQMIVNIPDKSKPNV